MQASLPNMHLPILNALAYPARLDCTDKRLVRELRWADVARLNFEALDEARFPCFRLAVEAAQRGGTYPCALVGADEEAVELFLAGRMSFLGIAALIEAVLERHQSVAQPSLEDILEACAWARRTARELCEDVHIKGMDKGKHT
jgi:1-deoxy-D-xylulose-5-phosphate reductoisomerase